MKEHPEYVVTTDELKALARYWCTERIVHDLWFFLYQQTGGAELHEHFMIDDHHNRLHSILGAEAMQEAWDTAVRLYRRGNQISDEDWRIITSGTEHEKDAVRERWLAEEEETTGT